MTDAAARPTSRSSSPARSVDDAVAALRPDYRALLIAVDGLAPAARATTHSEALLVRAESRRAASSCRTPRSRSCRTSRRGARPTGRSAPSRNAPATASKRSCAAPSAGLPRVNRLTDIYNAISVIHQVPLGGEDLTAYAGAPRLVRATGAEPFDTVADGETVVEHPEPGEVVWCDDAGVTCRRWNWRQGRRTQLTPDTTSALFILDALAPMTDDALTAAGDDLVAHLRRARRRRPRRHPPPHPPRSATVQEHP